MSNSNDKCGKHLHMGKCCEHVNCCILLVWVQKTGLDKWKLSQKSSTSSSGLASGPVPSPFSHSHLRAQTKGTGPRDGWFALEHGLHGPQQDSQPQHTLAWLCNPPHFYQSPQAGFLQSVVLSVPYYCRNPEKGCFQFSKTETSACNFENPCQGSRLLF